MSRIFAPRLPALILLATLSAGSHAATSPSFADDEQVVAFARDLEQRHGFNADELLGQFAQTRPNDKVLQLIKPPASPLQRSWWPANCLSPGKQRSGPE